MKSGDYDHEAREILRLLPPGPRLAVIGSASYWGPNSHEICRSAGTQLATLESLVLLTGGVPGVGESVGRSFCAARHRAALPLNTYHVLPHGCANWDYAVTVFAGASMGDRREILGRLARIYLVAEGGPGTVHEAEVARGRGAMLVPIGRTGGYSQEIYARLDCPMVEIAADWRTLGDGDAGVEEVGVAVKRIVEALAREAGERSLR